MLASSVAGLMRPVLTLFFPLESLPTHEPRVGNGDRLRDRNIRDRRSINEERADLILRRRGQGQVLCFEDILSRKACGERIGDSRCRQNIVECRIHTDTITEPEISQLGGEGGLRNSIPQQA